MDRLLRTRQNWRQLTGSGGGGCPRFVADLSGSQTLALNRVSELLAAAFGMTMKGRNRLRVTLRVSDQQNALRTRQSRPRLLWLAERRRLRARLGEQPRGRASRSAARACQRVPYAARNADACAGVAVEVSGAGGPASPKNIARFTGTDMINQFEVCGRKQRVVELK